MAVPTAQGHGVLPRGDTRWGQGHCRASVLPCTSAGMKAAEGPGGGCHCGQDTGCPSIPVVPRSCCPPVPAKSRGEQPCPPQQGSWGFGGAQTQSPRFPLPLSQCQAERNSCKVTRGQGTRCGELAGGPPRSYRGNRESQSSGDKAVPSLGGNGGAGEASSQDRVQGTPGRVPCPLAVPEGQALAGWIRRYHSSLRWRVRCWYRSRSGAGAGWSVM